LSIKLVTFDVYMALLDIEGSLRPVVQETLGLNADIASAFVRLWRTKQMERAAISNSLGGRRISFGECTAMALDYCLGRNNITIGADTHSNLLFAWDKIKPWPDAENAIAAVKAMGCQTAILSNGDQRMLEAVALNFSAHLFDYILSSEIAGYYKPHPSIYNLPASILGISKENTIHIAGSPNDVLGAIAAGIQCIWSNRHGDQILDPTFPPTHEISNLTGVANLIDAEEML
jgi:2-haloacid dehalogenase